MDLSEGRGNVAREKKYMKHDEEDFPLENIWAQGNPEDFDLIFDNPSIRLYRLAKKAPQ